MLRRYGVRPRKRLSQNFLCDGNVLERIADEALGGADPPVIEIGAGLGGLTQRLAARSRAVTAIEFDQRLRPALDETLAMMANVRVIYDDFLALDAVSLIDEAFGANTGVIAGNIPYGITTPILERVFAWGSKVRRAGLLVQTEVAGRLLASPGVKAYGSLTLFGAYHGTITRGLDVPPHLFYPRPEVSSTLIIYEPNDRAASQVIDTPLFFRVVRAAFGQRRKTLSNALTGSGVVSAPSTAAEILRDVRIAPERRGETLNLEEFVRLANAIAESGMAQEPAAGDRRTDA